MFIRGTFPTIRYLEHLFRTGVLCAIANRPGEPKAYELSKLDWAGLEIASGRDSRRLGVWRIGNVSMEGGGDFENVRVEREAVLRVFPAEWSETAVAADLKSILREALRDNPNLTQTEAEKIARDRGAIETREKIRDVLKNLGGSTKPGPRGPRKNRAGPAA